MAKSIQLKDINNEEYYPYAIIKEYVLYNDDTGTTGTVTLSDTVANYKYIEIFFYGAYDYTRASIRVYKPNNKRAMLVTGYPNAGNTNLKMAVVKITNKSMAKKWYTEGNGTTWTNSNTVYIDRVVGYK